MPTALLRPNPFDKTHDFVPNCAYNRCLDLEDRRTAVNKSGTLEVLVCARFLGYMLIEAPSATGRIEFATNVARCVNYEAIQDLANMYKNHFIRCFRSNKGRTPIITHISTAPSFVAVKEANKSLLVETPKSHEDSKAKALIRDSYRCVLTGKLDSKSLMDGLVTDHGGELATTHAAHIFDRSTNEDLRVAKKADYAASAHAVLDRFGQIPTIKELNGLNVHQLENILTLESNVHDWFDQLAVWMERKPEVNI